MNRQTFEHLILQQLKDKYKSGRYDPLYHIKRNIADEYICYETEIAWEWYCKHLG